MLKTVFKREILHNLYSLRFLLSLALVLGVFAAGSFSFIGGRAVALEKYRQTMAAFTEGMKKDAAANATTLAVTLRTLVLRPRDNAFMDDAKEKYLPNAVTFSAWNVFGFENRSGSANPFLKKFDELNWSFIAALIASFVALLFTFDAVSGEKESRTLALALSNPVPRGTLLFAKYLSAVLSVMALLLAGVLLSLLIILVLDGTSLSPALAVEAAGFMAAATLLVSAMAAFGLLASVVAPNSNVSLLLALSFWLAFAVIIPNSSLAAAKTLFPIESSESVQKRIDAAFADLNKSAPPGSWMQNSSNPFLPQHKLRADLHMKRLRAEKAIRDDYDQAMFRQFERTRLLTALSPVSQFEYMAEAAAGGGYVRFRKAWSDLHAYQGRFLDFFLTLDAADKDSPHWLNPRENVSTTRKPTAFEKAPRFEEARMSFAERAAPALKFLIIGVFYSCAVFLLTFVLFVRYDVR